MKKQTANKTIIFGATGRVGSALVIQLVQRGINTTAIVRNSAKVSHLPPEAKIATADLYDANAMEEACRGAQTMFIVTPENPVSNNVLGDAQTIIDNYLHAATKNEVLRIVALSSMGAQHSSATGNLQISHMLEQAFKSYKGETVIIRPGYYYSNWLGYLQLVREHGILPTFFPPEQSLHMVSPGDIALFAAQIISRENSGNNLYEVGGPVDYSSNDVARILGNHFGRKVVITQIPRHEWEATMLNIGFSADAAHNFALMSAAVVDGRSEAEHPDKIIRMETTLESYFKNNE